MLRLRGWFHFTKGFRTLNVRCGNDTLGITFAGAAA
jgi:hypothetical protein